MSSTRSGGAPDESETGLWTTETLPLSLRRELLERELNKLGFRKAAQSCGSPSHDGGSAQQQGDTASSHPQADAGSTTRHGE